MAMPGTVSVEPGSDNCCILLTGAGVRRTVIIFVVQNYSVI